MLHTLNLIIFVLFASIWVGGMVAIFIVARVASRTLETAQRIAFFRSLGRTYGIVGTLSLLVALAAGAVLLDSHPWDGLLIATAIVSAGLLAATVTGMAQARTMTRLRRRALEVAPGVDLQPDLRRGARLATLLRSAIALFTLVLVVLGSVLAA